MSSCIFCQIIRRERTAYIIYENDKIIAFLDKYPLFKGHTLILPKEHYENIFEIPDSILCEVVRVVKKIAKAQIEALNANGVRILQNNGRAAKQMIFHMHFHLIPFYYGLKMPYHRAEIRKNEAEKVVYLLKKALSSLDN